MRLSEGAASNESEMMRGKGIQRKMALFDKEMASGF